MNKRRIGETMTSKNRSAALPIFLFILATIGFFYGWRALWFLTDDAFIAFRYVSNNQLGYGYVWNAPPFLPVEGYTSFLWMVMLNVVWSVTGVEPPQSCNWLACVFGIGSLAMTTVMVLRMRLCSELRRYKSWFLFVVLLGMTTNVSFLMWTSSGLETSLYNFLFVAWTTAALYLERGSRRWMLLLTLTGSMLALTRPDGLLALIASAALVTAAVTTAQRRVPYTRLVFAWPLALAVVHILWRKSFYGEWLPNSYYAKHVSAWPEAGIRYLLSPAYTAASARDRV